MLLLWRQYLTKIKDYDGGMVTSVNQSDFVKTALRLPPDMHARLHEAAQESGRSYNAEIVARLQSTFKPEQKTFDFDALPGIIEGLHNELLTQKQAIAELTKAGAQVTYGEDGGVKMVKLTASRKKPAK